MSESSGRGAKDHPILPVTPQADARARRFERAVRRERHREYAVIIDNESGLVIGDRIRGGRSAIQFTQEQLESMRGRLLTHNHPDGWRYPADDPRRQGAGFSVRDVRLMADWRLAEMRVVTPGYLYRLRPPKDANSQYHRFVRHDETECIDRIVRQVFTMAEISLQDRVVLEEITQEGARVLFNHEAMLALEQDWGVEDDREVFP